MIDIRSVPRHRGKRATEQGAVLAETVDQATRLGDIVVILSGKTLVAFSGEGHRARFTARPTRGLLTKGEADAIDAGRQLRNRIVHGHLLVTTLTPGAAAQMLEATHAAISDLYERAVAT